MIIPRKRTWKRNWPIKDEKGNRTYMYRHRCLHLCVSYGLYLNTWWRHVVRTVPCLLFFIGEYISQRRRKQLCRNILYVLSPLCRLFGEYIFYLWRRRHLRRYMLYVLFPVSTFIGEYICEWRWRHLCRNILYVLFPVSIFIGEYIFHWRWAHL